jgi:hypothetical protein
LGVGQLLLDLASLLSFRAELLPRRFGRLVQLGGQVGECGPSLMVARLLLELGNAPCSSSILSAKSWGWRRAMCSLLRSSRQWSRRRAGHPPLGSGPVLPVDLRRPSAARIRRDVGLPQLGVGPIGRPRR